MTRSSGGCLSLVWINFYFNKTHIDLLTKRMILIKTAFWSHHMQNVCDQDSHIQEWKAKEQKQSRRAVWVICSLNLTTLLCSYFLSTWVLKIFHPVFLWVSEQVTLPTMHHTAMFVPFTFLLCWSWAKLDALSHFQYHENELLMTVCSRPNLGTNMHLLCWLQ